jgi:Putative Actinobacterial Holin-X, holin superfamily III
MHTPGTEGAESYAANGGVGAAAKEVAEHAGVIARLEAELAGLELKQKVAALGIGVGLALGAVVCVVYMLGFLFATIAAALATFLDTWLALLIVTLGLLAIAGILGLLARWSIRKGTPPVPEQAIAEAKLTTAAVKR